MTAPGQLAELQAWMLRAIAHDEGGDAAQRIGESRHQSAAERLAVYQHAYLSRLVECLCESFPGLLQAVGREAFDQFAIGYLRQHPPASYTLNDLAQGFPQFLRDTRPTDVPSPGWPDFLVELATMERTIEQVFDGPGVEDQPAQVVSDLARLSPVETGQLCFRPASCLRLLALQFPINDYYTHFKRGVALEWPQASPTWLAVTRLDYVVRRVALEQSEYQVLAALAAGDNLAVALSAVHGIEAAQVLEWFVSWGRLRLFEAVLHDDSLPTVPGKKL